jgi:Na+/H+-dicarboxylate symporter
MLAAPYGVFALLAALVVEAPSLELFQALALYAITLLLGLAAMIVVYIMIVRVFTKKKVDFFMKGIAPAQLLAFSTSSSAATLPVTMECVEENLGVDEEVASFVLPYRSYHQYGRDFRLSGGSSGIYRSGFWS